MPRIVTPLPDTVVNLRGQRIVFRQDQEDYLYVLTHSRNFDFNSKLFTNLKITVVSSPPPAPWPRNRAGRTPILSLTSTSHHVDQCQHQHSDK